MSDIWPDNLVEELAYRRCLIFLGSGISATAKNDAGESPDTWGAVSYTHLTLPTN